jgi:hypothetical protein
VGLRLDVLLRVETSELFKESIILSNFQLLTVEWVEEKQCSSLVHPGKFIFHIEIVGSSNYLISSLKEYAWCIQLSLQIQTALSIIYVDSRESPMRRCG